MTSTLVIATRESRLALWQAQHVAALLRQHLARPVELLGMTTRGDQILDRSLAKVGGKGLFVKELEAAMADGRAHLAVHSLKDVPMELPEGFALAAVLQREDARDAWVSNRYANLSALPKGACVGTSSLRRVAQLLAQRPDLNVQPLRGNLDTRLKKLDEGQYDGIVLASAGLIRLGLAERIRSVNANEHMLPAAGQGALGLESRSDDAELLAQLQALSHGPSLMAALAERAVSRGLGGSCSLPLAAHALWENGRLLLRAALGAALDPAKPMLNAQASAAVTEPAQAEALGAQVVEQLLSKGAQHYLSTSADSH